MGSILKTAFKIGGRTAPNRLTAQAMEINSAGPDGSVSEEIISRYEELARGDWGIVFVEAISVTPESLARKNGLVIGKKNLDGFKKLVEKFKNINPQSLIIFQLSHSGRNSGDFSNKVYACPPTPQDKVLLNESELTRIMDDFINAAMLSREAGADGVDIKACHGYLGGELLRPSNARPDSFGGSRENRARLLTEVIRHIKDSSPEFIAGTRISFYEGIRGGCGTGSGDEVIEEPMDILEILGLAVKAGADFLNVSAGIPVDTPLITRPDKKNMHGLYNHFRYAKTVKETFPETAVIGSAYSSAMELGMQFAEENIRKKYTDFAGFGRQNLADPLTPLKYFSGSNSIKYCSLCGGCSLLLKKQERVFCSFHNKGGNNG